MTRLSQTFAHRFDNGAAVFYLVLAVSAIPIWIGDIIPMVDLPQHAAQVAGLREYWQDNELFQSLFRVNWLTPYLTGYLLLYLLSAVLPIVIATKLLVTVAVLGVPVVTRQLLRETGGDPSLAILAIPPSFGFAYYWGMLSFIIAVPLGLLFLLATIRFERRQSLRAALMIAAFSVGLFFSHILVLCVTSLFALLYILGRNTGDLRRVAILWLPYTAALPFIAYWLIVAGSQEEVMQSTSVYYTEFTARVVELLRQQSGLGGLGHLPNFALAAVLFLVPLLNGSRLSSDPGRWLVAAAALAVFFALPTVAHRTGFVSERLGIFLAPCWLMLWDRSDHPRRLAAWLATAAVVLMITINSARVSGLNREAQGFTEAIDLMEPGQKVLQVIQSPNSIFFDKPVFWHLPLWYQAEKGGVVEFNFAWFHPQMLRYQQTPVISDRFAWNPIVFDWQQHSGESYRYFLVSSLEDIGDPLFKDARDKVTLRFNAGRWWLYERIELAP